MHYGTLPAADDYHAARGAAAWAAASEADRAAALIRASDWIDATYGTRFAGHVTDPAQPREWPRLGALWRGAVVPDDEIPRPIEYAAYEAGLRELEEPGSLAPDYDPTAQVVAESSAVGPLSESVTYAKPTSAAAARKSFPAVDGLLAALIGGGQGGNNFVIRRG